MKQVNVYGFHYDTTACHAFECKLVHVRAREAQRLWLEKREFNPNWVWFGR